jgi:hypothetical protein
MFRTAALLFALGCAYAPAWAVDAFEIQVYDASVNRPGEAGLEVHANYTPAGNTTGAFPGQVPPDHLAHLTFEPSYGLTPWWELGGYLQTAYSGDGGTRFGGWKLRTKFARPYRAGEPVFLAVNFELSHVPDKFEESEWGGEIRPIIGTEQGRWFLSVNPILSWGFSGAAGSATPEFEPAAKLRWDTHRGFGLGFEYYAGLGPVNGFLPARRQEQYLYAAYDLLGSHELNIGVGRGLSPASNDWTLKMITGFSF